MPFSQVLFITCPSARYLPFNFPGTTVYLPGYLFIYLLRDLPANCIVSSLLRPFTPLHSSQDVDGNLSLECLC